MTTKEAERREQFWTYDDFDHVDREEMRRMYYALRADPVDIAGEYDTDMGTVFRIVTEAGPEWRRKRSAGCAGATATGSDRP